MVGRNLVILVLDALLGLLMGLEMKLSLLGQLFIEPYHSLFPAFWATIALLWLFLQIPIFRSWLWSLFGGLVTFGVAIITPLLMGFPISPEAGISTILALLFILAAIFISSRQAQTADRLSRLYNQSGKKIPVFSTVGPYWLLLSIVLGIICGIALYYSWIPTAYLTFISSPEIFRMAVYFFFASLSGIICLSPTWGGFSGALFPFFTEFTYLLLYTTFASLQQFLWEVGGIFIDPARFTMPLIFIVLSFIGGWMAGRYSRRRYILVEIKKETELEKKRAEEVKLAPEGIPQIEEVKEEIKEGAPQGEVNEEVKEVTKEETGEERTQEGEVTKGEAQITCPACGENVSKSASFCPSCGQKL